MTSTNISDLPYTTPPAVSTATVKMPERDIPRETLQHTVDPQATVQYLPPRTPDYIPAPPQAQSKWDYSRLYDEFRIPIILILLYFVFQLDTLQNMLRKVLPILFTESGNLTSRGVFVKSALFGSAYYMITLLMQHLSRP